jgi:hypothetical protein
MGGLHELENVKGLGNITKRQINSRPANRVFSLALICAVSPFMAGPTGWSQSYVWTTLAGSQGNAGGADGTNGTARFDHPFGVAVDDTGDVFVADNHNHTLRRITPAGAVTTIGGLAGAAGNEYATESAARFNYPTGVAVDGAGIVYVADEVNQTIRQGTFAAPDSPVIDRSSGPAGARRQLEVSQATATNWVWRIFTRPSASKAELSSATRRDPTFTPDSAGGFVFQLRATNSLGQVSIRNLAFTATAPVRVRLDSLVVHNGYANLTVLGDIGTACQIQTASGLSGSNSWSLLTILNLTNAIQMWTDPTPASETRRFYRAGITP